MRGNKCVSCQFVSLTLINVLAPYFQIIDEGFFILLQYPVVERDMRHLVE